MHENDPVSTLPHRRDGVAGMAAAAAALGAGELVSAFDPGGTSLVSAVGNEFIDRFAASLKDLAISLFGTNDKVALVVGIVVVSLLIGAQVGRAARRRPWVGDAAFAAFGVLGGLAFARAPLASAVNGWLAATTAVVAGVVALRFLLARSAAVPAADLVADGVVVGGRVVAAPRAPAAMDPRGAPRRAFLGTAAAVTVGAAGAAALGRSLRGAPPGDEVRLTTDIPEPAVVVAPAASSEAFAIDGLSPYVTPNRDFYRIDTALTVPRIDPASWLLGFGGRIDNPFSVTFDELLAMASIEVPVTLSCVSNEVGGGLVGNAVWQGVPLSDLLDRAGVQPDGTQVVGVSVDRFTAGFPTELAYDGRVAMVAYAMNGELLPPEHGFPARLVVSGLYGYVSATKWLAAVELTRLDEFDGYWIPRGWSKDGPIKTSSRIDVPRSGQRVTAGPTPVAGVAWAPSRGIAAVEVQVDDGPWQPCELGDAASEHTWVQWLFRWDAPAGEHTLRVRATDGDGEVQTEEIARPDPNGATGLHARRVRVD